VAGGLCAGEVVPRARPWSSPGLPNTFGAAVGRADALFFAPARPIAARTVFLLVEGRAMNLTGPSSHPDPEAHRNRLRRRAARALPRCLAGKVDPSDIVQEALLNVWNAGDETDDFSAEERLALLQTAVDNIVRNRIREHFRHKRDVSRERPLTDGEGPVAKGQSTPSQQADRHEQEARLEEALLALPDDQRNAVFLHYYKHETVANVAAVLGRTESAVGGLLKRGLERLRELLGAAGSCNPGPRERGNHDPHRAAGRGHRRLS
jgi:RNA polymerase sigma-70 factor (ECF subfamily)